MKYLLGIDNGGTFSKAAIFSEFGEQIAVSKRKTNVYIPKKGYAERILSDLYEINIEIIKEVIKKSNIDKNNIAGISFSGHGKGLYVIGEDNKPLINGILSTDTRAQEIVASWEQIGVAEKIRAITYQYPKSCHPGAILAYFKLYKKDILKQIKYIFSVNDYIRFALIGEANSEYSMASGNGFISLKDNKYNNELMNLYDLLELKNKLPPLKKSYEVCGYISKEVANITGLKEGTPVSAGMFDIDACAIATGIYNEDYIGMIAGTWSINEYISKTVIEGVESTANSIYCMDGYYLIEESSATSAGNLEWFIRNIINTDYEKEKENIYIYINSLIESVAPEDNNLFFFPYINGSMDNVSDKASFFGLSMEHRKAHMLRAIYEGIVFSHKIHLEKLLINRKKPKAIRLSGGAANSEQWAQIFADVTQIPIEIVADKELGAQGAAMAAGISCGIYKNFIDAIEKSVNISKRFEPQIKYKNIYEKKYEKYKNLSKKINCLWSCIE